MSPDRFNIVKGEKNFPSQTQFQYAVQHENDKLTKRLTNILKL